MKELRITQHDLADLVGVKTRGAIGHYLTGRRNPTLEQLEKFAQALEVSVDWLLGEDRATSQIRVSQTIPTETDEPQDKDLPDKASAPPGSIPVAWDDKEDLPPKGNYVEVPHHDIKLSAGHGACTFEWISHDDDPLVFRAGWFRSKRLKPHHCRLLYVRGDSMEPDLHDGDAVMIDTNDHVPRDGEVYAVLYSEELFIQRLFKIPGGGLELHSDNDRYPPRYLRTPEELETVRILGKKVWRGG